MNTMKQDKVVSKWEVYESEVMQVLEDHGSSPKEAEVFWHKHKDRLADHINKVLRDALRYVDTKRVITEAMDQANLLDLV